MNPDQIVRDFKSQVHEIELERIEMIEIVCELDLEYEGLKEKFEIQKKEAGVIDPYEVPWEAYLDTLSEEKRDRLHRMRAGFGPIRDFLRYKFNVSHEDWNSRFEHCLGMVEPFYQAEIVECGYDFHDMTKSRCEAARDSMNTLIYMATWMLKMLADHKFVMEALQDPEFGKLTGEEKLELQRRDQELETLLANP